MALRTDVSSQPVTQYDSAGNEVVAPALVGGGVPVTLTGGEATDIASAAYTATQDSLDLTNTGRGILIAVDVTLVPGAAPSLTPKLFWKIPATGAYKLLWAAAVPLTAVGTYTYLLHPDATDLGSNFTETVRLAVPKTLRIEVTAANANSATYSASHSTLN